MKIRSKNLKELKAKLLLLSCLKERQEIILCVKGNPALELFRDELLSKTKSIHLTWTSPYCRSCFRGKIIDYTRILDVEPIFRTRMPVYGFFYFVDKDWFVFEENPMQSSGVRRALEFVRLLKGRRRDRE